MRIGLLTQWYDPEPGPAALPGVLARELVRRGHEVHVLTGFPNYPTGQIQDGYKLKPYMYEELDGVHVHRLWLYPNHDSSAWSRVLNYGSFGISAIAGAVTLPQLDVLWVNYSPITTAFSMWALQLFQGVPTVIEIGDLWPDTMLVSGLDGSSRLERLAGLLNGWTDAMYSSADAVVTISPGVVPVLQSRGVPKRKITYIPKWADESIFHPGGKSLRGELGIPEDYRVLLYAGAMGEAQGLSRLVNAVGKLNEQGLANKFVLLMAGSGTQQEQLKDLAQRVAPEQIRFIGRVRQQDMTDLLATADAVFVGLRPHALTHVTMPSKTQSSMAAGKMLLVDAQGDVNAVVTSARAGLVNQSSTQNELEENLERFVKMPDAEIAAYGQAAREYYLRHSSCKVSVDRYERLFSRVRRLRRWWFDRRSPSTPLEAESDGEITYRPLQFEDAREVAQLHIRAFPEFFMASLGVSFLSEFYRGYCLDPSAVTLVALSKGKMIGVVVGTVDPSGFYARLLKARLIGFGVAAAKAAIHRPLIIPRLLRGLLYRGDQQEHDENVALLASVCVEPDIQARGLGTTLINRFVEEAGSRGVDACYLLTDAENNDQVNNFYQKNGWSLEFSFETPEGRKMNRYRIAP